MDHVLRQRIPGVREEPSLGVAGDRELLGMGTVAAVPGPFPCLVSWPAALCLIHETKKHKGGKKDCSAETPPKQSLTPTSKRQQGGHCHSSLPHNHDFPTPRLSVCPAMPPSPGAPCWFPLEESPSSRGDLGNSRAHGRLRSQASHHRQGLAGPVEVKITHWRFVSKSPQ